MTEVSLVRLADPKLTSAYRRPRQRHALTHADASCATIDDAIERLCLIAKIEGGLRQSEAGQLTDHEEVKKRLLA